MRLIPWLLPVLILVSSFTARQAYATHIVGGDLNIIYNSGDDYRLRLTLYFDMYRGLSGAFSNKAQVRIFSKRTHALMSSEIVELTERTRVTYTNTECPTGRDSLKTDRLRYEKVITLAASKYGDEEGYYAVTDICCRNGAISNVVRPDLIGQLFYLEFPSVVWKGQPFRNSSPINFKPLSDYGCVGRLFAFDFSGQDMEGDSMVYSMAKPWVGFSSLTNTGAWPSDTMQPKPMPYPMVNWKPGITTEGQISGSPGLSIDSITGFLTMRPNKVGLFVFAVECREYRKGRFLGLARRDFQILIMDCEKNTVPVISLRNAEGDPTQDGDTLQVNFEQGKVCFNMTVEDSVPDNMNIVLQAPGLEGFATITESKGRTTTGQMLFNTTICVEPCIQTEGSLLVPAYLKVTDNACSLPNFSTLTVFMKVHPIDNRPTLGNIVTPNDDGHNDVLSWLIPSPAYNCKNNFEELTIYNRWGKRVLSTTDFNFMWPTASVAKGLYTVAYRYGGKRYTQWVEVAR